MRKTTFLLLIFLHIATIEAQENILNIDSCRALAIRNNKELQMAKMKTTVAGYERKAAFTNYLPKISASGAYMRSQKELSLLNSDQKLELENFGTSSKQQVQNLLKNNPQLGELLAPFSSILQNMDVPLNAVGQSLVNALRTDTRNMAGGAVTLTQPLYMGGKIIAYNRITRYAEEIARNQHDLQWQELIVEVDQTYWQIVSLQTKKKLAESYLELLEKLDDDVEKMKEEGFATKADALSVKVKKNEAEVTLIQVNNGLSLSRMLLCQLCGLNMKQPIKLADEDLESVAPPEEYAQANPETAFTNRPELKSLDLSTRIYKEKVNVARAEFLPKVALTGNYLVSNPSVFNSFQQEFNGMWCVGVMVNIPILTWGERSYKIKAAKTEARIASFRLEETREKVELQINQNAQKLEEAMERLSAATRSQEKADENLRYATLGMKEGVIPVSNVLEAQTAWLSARSERITAQIDLKLANLYLQKSLGTIK